MAIKKAQTKGSDMRSVEFRRTHSTLVKMAHIGIQEIVKIFNEVEDPLVKTLLFRRWKNNYDFPSGTARISAEFSVLGRIYRESLKDYRRYDVRIKDDRIKLAPIQEMKLRKAMRDAMKWTYTYWSAVTMARVLVRGGGYKFMDLHIREYNLTRNNLMLHSDSFSELLSIFFD